VPLMSTSAALTVRGPLGGVAAGLLLAMRTMARW
jgi:hypothetical protein